MSRLCSVTLSVLVLMAGTAVALGAPVQPPADAAVSVPAAGRDTVVIGMTREPDTLHPLFRLTSAADVILPTLFLDDVQRDNRWHLSPLGVEQLPNLADGTWRVDGNMMVLTWRIRSGRHWQDGRSVTCSDYVFTHRVAIDPRVPTHPTARMYRTRVATVTCPQGAGGRTVVVTWRERDPYAQIRVVYPPYVLPRHTLEAFYRASPARFDTTGYGLDPSVTMGDGAFRLVEWRRGQSLTVESAGVHPILGSPRLKRITWRFFATSDALVRDMESGSIDAISGRVYDRPAGRRV